MTGLDGEGAGIEAAVAALRGARRPGAARPGSAGTLAAYAAPRMEAGARARLMLWAAGAALSVGLVAGVGVWGYRLLAREVLGPPVVQAAEGPMRVAPAEPGGEVAAHQGLSVNGVAGVGEAAAPSDVLVLAPPTSDLSPEDLEVTQSMAEAGEPLPPGIAPAEPAPPTPDASLTAAPDAAPPASPEVATVALDAAAADPVAAAVAAAAASAAAPGGPAEDAPATSDAPVPEAVAVVVIPADVPGVASALRPPARPGGTLAALQGVEPTAAEAAAPPAVTADLPAGTSLVQLGAFPSADLAAAEWDRLSGAFAGFLQGKERVIQEARSDGRTFFRLRATGFSDVADARRLCAALVAEDAGCIPVVVN